MASRRKRRAGRSAPVDLIVGCRVVLTVDFESFGQHGEAPGVRPAGTLATVAEVSPPGGPSARSALTGHGWVLVFTDGGEWALWTTAAAARVPGQARRPRNAPAALLARVRAL